MKLIFKHNYILLDLSKPFFNRTKSFDIYVKADFINNETIHERDCQSIPYIITRDYLASFDSSVEASQKHFKSISKNY